MRQSQTIALSTNLGTVAEKSRCQGLVRLIIDMRVHQVIHKDWNLNETVKATMPDQTGWLPRGMQTLKADSFRTLC